MRNAIVACLLLVAAAAGDEVPAALGKVRHAFVGELEKLVQWCGDHQVYEDRAATCELILRFEPDHREARKCLKYVLRDGAWVRPSTYSPSRNLNSKAHAEYLTRRAAVVSTFADTVVAALEQQGQTWGHSARKFALEDALAADPNHKRARELNGQVPLENRWVLEETARSIERRKALVRAAREALEKVPDPRAAAIDAYEKALGVPWTDALETPSWRVVSVAGAVEARDAVRVATAAGPFFECCFGVEVPQRAGQALYLMTHQLDYQHVVCEGPGSTREFRKFALALSSTWLPGTNRVLICASDSGTRLEFAARQPLSCLLDDAFGIRPAQGWVSEGVGLYLAELLTGTHTTYFVRRAEYARDEQIEKAALWQRIREPRADWFAIGRALVRDGHRPDLPFLLARDLNTMDAESTVFSYCLAAYLLEGQAERAPKLLQAIGRDERPFHEAFPEILGFDVTTLEERLVTWLHERGGGGPSPAPPPYSDTNRTNRALSLALR